MNLWAWAFTQLSHDYSEKRSTNGPKRKKDESNANYWATSNIFHRFQRNIWERINDEFSSFFMQFSHNCSENEYETSNTMKGGTN